MRPTLAAEELKRNLTQYLTTTFALADRPARESLERFLNDPANGTEGTQLSRLLSLGAFNLRTELRDTGHGRDRLGFAGTATLQLAGNAPAVSRKAFGALARFAEYCGTGAQTTHGFGATIVTSADA